MQCFQHFLSRAYQQTSSSPSNGLVYFSSLVNNPRYGYDKHVDMQNIDILQIANHYFDVDYRATRINQRM
jgi:hypothetical protein